MQAPGEAEAELAQMSKLGKIDAVLTDDVDALVFGATKILRKSVNLSSYHSLPITSSPGRVPVCYVLIRASC